MDADAVEIRVLGCLIEKQRTTPDVYPLSMNALRAACNQSTNRQPVVEYDEGTIRDALARLARKRWVRLASGPASRAVKYRHLLDEALGLSDPEIALACVLMLRGPQTLGELKQRSERLYPFDSLGDVERTLDGLVEREAVARLPRRPGQKEQRYAQLLGGDDANEGASAPAEHAPATGAASEEPLPRDDRVAALEERVDRLEEDVASLRQALESLPSKLNASAMSVSEAPSQEPPSAAYTTS
jgi:uncharacterized protein YceH (UPF0502 family)